MDKNLTELCCLLVEEFYGDLCAQIFRTLAERGRITLRSLLQHSSLPTKHVYHGLTVLVQQHLVLHHTTITTPTHLEVDWKGAYGLMQNGKLLTSMEERFGPKAAHVVAALLQLGHARVEDMERALAYGKGGKQSQTSTNGTGYEKHDTPNSTVMAAPAGYPDDRIRSREELHNILHRLLKAGFVCRVHPRTYQPETDKQNSVEDTVKDDVFKGERTTGPKMKIKFDEEVRRHKRRQEELDDDVSAHVKQSSKRRKLDGPGTNGCGPNMNDRQDAILDGSLVLKINLEKCMVALRSDRLVRHAQRLLGDTTARVYEAFLRVYEYKTRRCRADEEMLQEIEQGDNIEDDDSLRITTEDVMVFLEEEGDPLDWLDIRLSTIEDKPPLKRVFKSKGPRESQGGIIQRRNRYLQELGAHLGILSEHQLHFTSKLSSQAFGEFALPIRGLMKALRYQEIEDIIAARFGSVALRIVRLLRRIGKLDEKAISDRGLMRIKDVRNILDKMQETCFIETQEIARDASRQPSRAYYLWFFDQDRFERRVLEKSYIAMSRCLQRRRVQRERVRDVIEKAERSDVVGHEDEFLTDSDKMHLRSWQEQEEKVLSQMARMDDTITLIRDF